MLDSTAVAPAQPYRVTLSAHATPGDVQQPETLGGQIFCFASAWHVPRRRCYESYAKYPTLGRWCQQSDSAPGLRAGRNSNQELQVGTIVALSLKRLGPARLVRLTVRPGICGPRLRDETSTRSQGNCGSKSGSFSASCSSAANAGTLATGFRSCRPTARTKEIQTC